MTWYLFQWILLGGLWRPSVSVLVIRFVNRSVWCRPSPFTVKLPCSLRNRVSWGLLEKRVGLDVQEAIGKTIFENMNGKSQRRQREASNLDMRDRGKEWCLARRLTEAECKKSSSKPKAGILESKLALKESKSYRIGYFCCGVGGFLVHHRYLAASLASIRYLPVADSQLWQ